MLGKIVLQFRHGELENVLDCAIDAYMVGGSVDVGNAAVIAIIPVLGGDEGRDEICERWLAIEWFGM